MAKIDKSWLLVDINGLFEGVFGGLPKVRNHGPGWERKGGKKKSRILGKFKKIGKLGDLLNFKNVWATRNLKNVWATRNLKNVWATRNLNFFNFRK